MVYICSIVHLVTENLSPTLTCCTREVEYNACETISVHTVLFLVSEESEEVLGLSFLSIRLMQSQARCHVTQEMCHRQKHVHILPCHCSHVAGREQLSG